MAIVKTPEGSDFGSDFGIWDTCIDTESWIDDLFEEIDSSEVDIDLEACGLKTVVSLFDEEYICVDLGNVYNSENDFCKSFHYRAFLPVEQKRKDWIYSEDAIICISLHAGGSPMGNYHEPKLYKPKYGAVGDDFFNWNLLWLYKIEIEEDGAEIKSEASYSEDEVIGTITDLTSEIDTDDESIFKAEWKNGVLEITIIHKNIEELAGGHIEDKTKIVYAYFNPISIE